MQAVRRDQHPVEKFTAELDEYLSGTGAYAGFNYKFGVDQAKHVWWDHRSPVAHRVLPFIAILVVLMIPGSQNTERAHGERKRVETPERNRLNPRLTSDLARTRAMLRRPLSGTSSKSVNKVGQILPCPV